MPLTDLAVRNAKPAAKPYKLADGNNLYLYVAPSGSRTWWWRTKADGKPTTVTLGRYPEMSLRQAREARDKKQVERRQGGATKAAKPTETLERLALTWHSKNAMKWKPHHADEIMARLTKEIFPSLGARPFGDISPADLLRVIERLEQRSIDVARRIRATLEHVFDFGLSLYQHQNPNLINPALAIAKQVSPLPPGRHHPHAASIEQARSVLAQIDAVPASTSVRLAMRFLALTAVRPGEAVGARWSEFTSSGDEWHIPAARMKLPRPHIVPLSPGAIEALAAARSLAGAGECVFPAKFGTDRPIAENTLNVLVRRAELAGKFVPHGWRATFSTIMNERDRTDGPVIELMLAHVRRDKVKAAYDHAEHMPRRRELALLWADLLLDGALPAVALLDAPRRRSVSYALKLAA